MITSGEMEYEDRIFFVGNTMIDTLIYTRPRFRKPALWDELRLKEKGYIVLTLHRPNNVDDSVTSDDFLMRSVTIRTAYRSSFRSIRGHARSLTCSLTLSQSQPLSWQSLSVISSSITLLSVALAVITDSGGITEETTVMGVPCMTLRNSTERPETVTHGNQ